MRRCLLIEYTVTIISHYSSIKAMPSFISPKSLISILQIALSGGLVVDTKKAKMHWTGKHFEQSPPGKSNQFIIFYLGQTHLKKTAAKVKGQTYNSQTEPLVLSTTTMKWVKNTKC